MYRATLRQFLWICIIWAAKVEARVEVKQEEKESIFVNPSYDLCEQIQCLRVEDILYKTVDLRKNPCDNYHQYACHKNYTEPGDHEPFFTDPNKVFKDLRDILERDISPLDQGNHALNIERKIFQHCVSGEAFNYKAKEYYDGTVLPRSNANRLLATYDYGSNKNYWDDVDLKYALKGFGFAFFDIDIYQEPNQDTYYGSSQCANGRCVLIKPPSYIISDLLTLLDSYFAKYNMGLPKYSNLREFMKRLQNIVNVPQGTNVAVQRISEWQQSYDSHVHGNGKIDWFNYFSKLFGIVKQPVRASTFIAIQNQKYFEDLCKLLGDTHDTNTIVDYIHLQFVSKSVGLVSAEYRQYSILPQIKYLPCTPGLLAGTAYKYAEEQFPEENRKLLESVILKVRDTVIARVKYTRKSVFVSQSHKLSQLMFDFIQEYENAEVYAGYPNWLMDETVTYKIYGNSISQGENFYIKQTNLIERLLRVKLQSLTTPNMPIFDPTELSRAFESNKIEIRPKKNATFMTDTKEIVIPFGYFNERDYKFFSSQLFDPINYGAAAVEIAFKLYSKFLDTIEYAEIAPKCIRDQLRSVDDSGNRKAYLKRAVAYLLALDAAYESWPSKNSYPIQFVDFGAVTDNDLFFLSFAKSLCTIPPKQKDGGTEEEHPYRKRDDYYAMSQQMNFTLQNFQPFLDNYICQNYSVTSREKQCDPFAFQL